MSNEPIGYIWPPDAVQMAEHRAVGVNMVTNIYAKPTGQACFALYSTPPQIVRTGDGMLPDKLVPYSKEWYILCERRFGATKIAISGELAEAIVQVVGDYADTKQPDQKALKFLLTSIGSWTNSRWDQHLRFEFGDELAQPMIDSLTPFLSD